ncbi:MFS transporter [Candidatus Leptofilum sp.]|uniref:MFS transporter n=1 Tax=Candidatus Leptofilum sp. TaxID=3241576 RepID=UPI003B5A9C17
MAASTLDNTESTPKLSFGRKLAFGIGDLGPALVASIQGFFLNAFLLDIAGIRPAAAGIIFLIVKIWDSVNDPLIGRLTDRTNTRWGRRRPWLLFGAIPFGLAWFMQWLVPDLGPNGLFWYYLIVALLLDTGFTAVNVPYTALTPELTQDYDERTSLNSFRFSFSILGGLAALAVHSVLIEAFPTVTQGYAISAAVMGGIIILSNFITFAFTKETHFKDAAEEDDPGFIEGVKIALRNRPFLYVVAIYLLSWLCIQFVQANMLLYVRYWVGGEDRFIQLAFALQVSAFVFLIMWSKISQKWGKQNVYYVGMSFWIFVQIAIFFVQPGQFNLVLGLAVLAGVGVSVGYLIPWSMLPDVVELDELETGQRREGIYYGFFVFLQKLGISLGLALSNFALEAAGYINAEDLTNLPEQPTAVLTALRIFVSLVPAVILLLSFPIVRSYPITREKHAEILAAIAAKKQS